MKVGASITVIRLLLMYHAINEGRGYHHCDKAAVDVSCYQ